FDASMMNGLQTVTSFDTFIPWVSDHLGRRWAIIIGSVIMMIGAAIQAAAQNFAMFPASSLIGELSHPKERAILGSLFNSCYFIGSIVAAGITLVTFSMPTNWGWRIPSLLQARGENAFAILARSHAEGDVNSEFFKLNTSD
ncbi:hypothetical protein MPER_05466, partial [Moniliophthora perniciosa FA553]